MKYRHSSGVMRSPYPHAFGRRDFTQLSAFLGQRTIAIVDALENRDISLVALRHDVDHNLEHAVRFAEWEAERGLRATYYVLPSAWYWEDREAALAACRRLVDLGHEVGIHNDTVAEAWRRGDRSTVDGSALPAGNCDAAAAILRGQVTELRNAGIEICGTSTHGTELWREEGITNVFLGAAGYQASDFGLRYADAYHLHRTAHYISDNRGQWSVPLKRHPRRQSHVLIHPAHWDLSSLEAAA